MNGDQCRAARAMLGIDRAELAHRSGVSVKVISGVENDDRNARDQAAGRLRAVLVVGGIVFLDEPGRQGVKLRGEDVLPAEGKPILPMIEYDTNGKADIFPQQCRAAREFLRWTREDAAKLLDVGLSTLQEFELGARLPSEQTRQKISARYAEHGVTVSGVRARQTVHLRVDDRQAPDIRVTPVDTRNG